MGDHAQSVGTVCTVLEGVQLSHVLTFQMHRWGVTQRATVNVFPVIMVLQGGHVQSAATISGAQGGSGIHQMHAQTIPLLQ